MDYSLAVASLNVAVASRIISAERGNDTTSDTQRRYVGVTHPVTVSDCDVVWGSHSVLPASQSETCFRFNLSRSHSRIYKTGEHKYTVRYTFTLLANTLDHNTASVGDLGWDSLHW